MVLTRNFAGPDALASAQEQEQQAGKPRPEAAFVCPCVDLDAAAHIGRLCLDAIAAASLHGEWSEPALVHLRRHLLERLVRKDKQKKDIEATLASFVGSQKGVATMMANAFKGENDREVSARVAEVEARIPPLEREAYAAVAIRHLRPELACSAQVEEHVCHFRPMLCPHAGCKLRFSAKAAESHDTCCAFKLVDCPKCGEQIPRGELKVHAMAACPMREAACTFSTIGCHTALSQRDVESHLEECTQAHLMLLLRTVMEQQDTIRTLSARVRSLEENASARDAEAAAQAAIAGQVAGLEKKFAALERQAQQDAKKAEGAVDDERKRAEAADKDVRKRMDAAAAAARAEVGVVRADFGKFQSSISELTALRADLGAVKASVAELLESQAPTRPQR